MTPPVPIHDYDGLIVALRARKAELGLTDETVDLLAGWAPRYCTKVLGSAQVRHLGPQSLEILLTVLASQLILLPDPAKLRRMEKRYETTTRAADPNPVQQGRHAKGLRIAKTRAAQREALRIHLSKLAKKGAKESAANRMKNRSPTLRRRIARQAARARWRKAKNKEERTCAGAYRTMRCGK